jgi:hypothetical protein
VSNMISPDRLYSPREVCEFEGCCMATFYTRMARHEYECYKDGNKTAITGASILERRRKVLKPATFKEPTQGPRWHTLKTGSSA